jgi:hypothetical protein
MPPENRVEILAKRAVQDVHRKRRKGKGGEEKLCQVTSYRLPLCGTGRLARDLKGGTSRSGSARPRGVPADRSARGSPNPARKTNTSRRRIARAAPVHSDFRLPNSAATQPQPDPTSRRCRRRRPRLRRQEQGSGSRVSLRSPLPHTRFTRRLATGGPRPLDSYARRPRRRSGRHRNPRVPTKQVADRPSCGVLCSLFSALSVGSGFGTGGACIRARPACSRS